MQGNILLSFVPQPVNQCLAELLNLLGVLESFIVGAAAELLDGWCKSIVSEPRITVGELYYFMSFQQLKHFPFIITSLERKAK